MSDEAFWPLPLVIRLETDDLPEAQQKGYARKEEVEINGVKYIQYFGPFGNKAAEPYPSRTHSPVIGEIGLTTSLSVTRSGMGRYWSESLDAGVPERDEFGRFNRDKYATAIYVEVVRMQYPTHGTRKSTAAAKKHFAKLERYVKRAGDISSSAYNGGKPRILPLWVKR